MEQLDLGARRNIANHLRAQMAGIFEDAAADLMVTYVTLELGSDMVLLLHGRFIGNPSSLKTREVHWANIMAKALHRAIALSPASATAFKNQKVRVLAEMGPDAYMLKVTF